MLLSRVVDTSNILLTVLVFLKEYVSVLGEGYVEQGNTNERLACREIYSLSISILHH